MKKIYFLFAAALSMTAAYSQSVVSGCNDPAGGIQIIFDESLGCNAGALAEDEAIGFHSGANVWSSVIDWDAATAVNGVNNGEDVFTVYLADPDAYYSTAVENIWFVFNQGPSDAMNPWSAEGKMDDGNGGCADFSINMADITETCEMSVSTRELLLNLDFKVLGNPFTDRAVVQFSNEDATNYTARLTDVTGRTLRTYTQVNTNQLTVERGELSSGFYFLTFTNQEGKFATVKLLAR